MEPKTSKIMMVLHNVGCCIEIVVVNRTTYPMVIQHNDDKLVRCIVIAPMQEVAAEPTVITAIDPGNVPQYNGLYQYITPDSRPLIVVGGQGWVFRVTSPNTVNACARLEYEE